MPRRPLTLKSLPGDVIGSLLDLETKEIIFSVNGYSLKPFNQVQIRPILLRAKKLLNKTVQWFT